MSLGYGMIGEFTLADNYSLSTGISIAYDGGKLQYGDMYFLASTANDPTPDSTIYTITRSYKLQYFEIPLCLKMETNEIGYITYWAKFGPGIGFNLKALGDDNVKNTAGVEQPSEDDIDIKMGTLSKTIPSVGGYIAGKKELMTFLRYSSNPFIFSAALPPPSAAAALKAFEIIENEPERIKQVQHNAKEFIKGVKELGFDTLKSKDTAIIPVIIGTEVKTFRFARKLEKEGIIVPPVVYPAVPRDGGRLRCCVMATHTEEDMQKILEKFEKVGKELEVI